jgi:hypothetical protein
MKKILRNILNKSYNRNKSWNIQNIKHTNSKLNIEQEVCLVNMNSNKVNSINQQFISDFYETLQIIDTNFAPEVPIIFSGESIENHKVFR